MVKSVLLCGCGNIGFRHLQALSAVDLPFRITVVEPFEGGHPRIEEQLTSFDGDGHRLLRAIPDQSETFDLAVIATNATTRWNVLNDLTNTHSIGCLILEKLLFQKTQELALASKRLSDLGIPAFVNCGRRGFPDYRKLAAEFVGKGPTDVTVTGGNFGLASNAIHFIDLAEFINGSQVASVDLSGLDVGSIPSKRPEFVEIFGKLTATYANGAVLTVDCANTEKMRLQLRMKNATADVTIDELGGKQTFNGDTRPFELKYVSGMPYLYRDALERGDPGLTPYAASVRQHRLYLNAMLAHLGLPVSPETVCPIS